MTVLRDQLFAARTEYERLRYPGDLADLLPDARERHAGAIAGRRRAVGALAAAIMLFVIGRQVQIGGWLDAPPSLAAIQLELRQWETSAASFTAAAELPKKTEMVNAVKTVTPPQTADLLSAVKKPVYDSGNFIVSIGRDLAHHADALLHLM
jgi:hypothetical protein